MFVSLLIIVFSAAQGVPVCEWGKYGHNCDRLCSDHCRLHPVRNLRHCQKYTGKCSEGCVRGRLGDLCDQLCSPNCIKTTCNQPNGGCTIGCMEGYIGYFCNITTVSAVQGVPVCEWGKYGHNCDRLCSDHCRLHPVRNLRHCQKYTGKCSEGCVRGRHGDLCDQLCSPNCNKTTCNQPNGGCTIGCMEGYSGYFCNITTVSAVQGVPVCEWGKYGHNCDRLCSDHCGLYLGRNLRPCDKATGKCLQGCVRGQHGDHCDQLCCQNCISTTCNQGNGGCTLGCIDGYIGYFCNTTTGAQIQTTVTTTYRPCDWGRFGETCDQACPRGCALGSDRNTNYCQTDTGTCTRGCRRGWHGERCEKLCGRNCIADTCHQGSGHCTHGCRGRYTGEFCEAETGEGHIAQSMQLMLSVAVSIFLTMCCWKSPRCRRTFDKGFTWLIRRNPRSSWSYLSERIRLLSTASHATPSQADLDLYYASTDGDLEGVRRLLSAGDVNINCRVWGMTPVMEAARWGHIQVVKLLECKGADVLLVDDGGNNTLHWACVSGNLVTVKFVLSLNVLDINSRGVGSRTPVIWAAVMGHSEVVKLLMNEGADVSLVDDVGESILHWACVRRDVRIVQSLNVKDIDVKNNNGRTAVDMVISMGHQRLVDILVSLGAQ
ncbi:multiple epidermal growth factor-like domains protein 10 isoform X2 [Haliotis rufescens]|uniref:multiple epidermal growth factor-like domains protein 10 isoform X2 n=1 Tax=Haliotis rufescens TaxID=6454 RepID=UPI00201E9C10|nr:multiple epidermal growth factor-like domains protein 10 isoform X2 [Haliotis rufescens]